MIKPLFDKVVIKAIESEEKTASGIVLPGAAKEKPQLAKRSRWSSRSATESYTTNMRAASST